MYFNVQFKNYFRLNVVDLIRFFSSYLLWFNKIKIYTGDLVSFRMKDFYLNKVLDLVSNLKLSSTKGFLPRCLM